MGGCNFPLTPITLSRSVLIWALITECDGEVARGQSLANSTAFREILYEARMLEARSSRLESDCPEQIGCLILRQIMTLGRWLTSLQSSVWSRPVLQGGPIALPTSISFFTYQHLCARWSYTVLELQCG